MPEPRRISASRLNSIDQCTMQFYLKEILGLPEKIWPRTSIGTVAHSILEALYRDKHRSHYNIIKNAQSIYASLAITRLARAWKIKMDISDDIMSDLDSMCMVAINHTNFLDEGAIKRFDPEHEFKLILSNGGIVKGFIDKVAQYPDGWIISDFKSARNKFSKAEVIHSYQSLVYQLYIWKTFKALASVQYIFLRHPPTKTAPQKHMMITQPASPEQLEGFEKYLEYMWTKVNEFGLEEAHSRYCSDQGFCDRVCSYRFPFQYWSITKCSTGAPVRTIWIDPKDPNALDIKPEVKYDEVIQLLSHGGCSKYNV